MCVQRLRIERETSKTRNLSPQSVSNSKNRVRKNIARGTPALACASVISSKILKVPLMYNTNLAYDQISNYIHLKSGHMPDLNGSVELPILL